MELLRIETLSQTIAQLQQQRAELLKTKKSCEEALDAFQRGLVGADEQVWSLAGGVFISSQGSQSRARVESDLETLTQELKTVDGSISAALDEVARLRGEVAAAVSSGGGDGGAGVGGRSTDVPGASGA